ncbi:MAG: magnesium-translocating P-type ATPase [Nitrospirota bacterium]|nr:magnesium-translocating P-type ATPase [Nitrospirota bacterium]
MRTPRSGWQDASKLSPQTKHAPPAIHIAPLLAEVAVLDAPGALARLGSDAQGLSEAEAAARLVAEGPNQVAESERVTWWQRLLRALRNPLVILLAVLASVSVATGDPRAASIMGVMIVIGVSLRFVQEARADRAADALKAMIHVTATAVRDGVEREIPLREIVRGDVVRLAAGDMIPADLRVLTARDLFVNQASLTGESLPVEKFPAPVAAGTASASAVDWADLCFLGTSVASGAATGVVAATGAGTYFGSLAGALADPEEETSFERGVSGFTWLMIRFMAVMVPLVFVINGVTGHGWREAFVFALAVAVGLTPEMLPMIVSVCLSRGAVAMSRKQVIVKRLAAIQNFGAMDVLCTDKTGTLTQGKIVLEKHLDAHGDPSERVLHYGYLNSYHHTGLKNLLDEAILNHEELEERLKANEKYRKIDEIPFDFVRRRMSVVVEDETGLNILICKGAVDEVLSLCTRVEVKAEVIEVLPEHDAKRRQLSDDLNGQGFRVIALAYKTIPNAPDEPVYSVKDEADLILLGFLAFLDPPKDTATEALKRLHGLNVDVKVLTGDNEIITAHICKEVGMPVANLLLGSQIEAMSETELAEAAGAASVFARLVPAHKERIIRALQSKGRVLGFLGDGINDAPALKAADVGISVDSAVDIAKESSDIILLKNSLLVLEQGVLEGRRVFGNIVKYIKMAASSNFGNMFSVVGASAFLPFLPMLPIQVLINNLLYDFSQTTIPTDEVDEDWLTKPRQWSIDKIRRFILFIGPISSIFDYLTFFLLLYLFNCWDNPALFHTGWFVESLFTQTLIIHVIRTNKIPFIQSRASWPLTFTSVIIVAVGAWLTMSPLANTLGFVQLPPRYWLFLALMLLGYAILTQVVKTWFIRRFGE